MQLAMLGRMPEKTQIDAPFVGLWRSNVIRFGAESWRFEFDEQTTLEVLDEAN